MKSRKYKDRDFRYIDLWYRRRGMVPLTPNILPKVGVIVPGIAAGFLMQTDTVSAILEPFISNPKADQKLRDAALYQIMRELIVTAQNLGYRQLFGFSSSKQMTGRALELGFKFIENGVTVCKDIH